MGAACLSTREKENVGLGLRGGGLCRPTRRTPKKKGTTMTGASAPPILVLDNGGHTIKLGIAGAAQPSL